MMTLSLPKSRILLPLMVALLLCNFADDAAAQKNGKGGGKNPPTPTQTVFYQSSQAVRAVDEFGGGDTLVGDITLVNAVPSAQVYGANPKLDRWWLTADTTPANTVEVYAIHPGRGLRIAVTDFTTDGRTMFRSPPYWDTGSHLRWSNDGVDSFFSFVTFDTTTGNGRTIHRINLSMLALEVMFGNNWTPLRLGNPAVETAWADGPGAPEDPGFIQIVGNDYCWSPNGQSMVAKTRETINLTDGIWAIQRHDLPTNLLSPLAFYTFGPGGGLRWAPNAGPGAGQILYRGIGLEKVAGDGQSGPEVVLDTSGKQNYLRPAWSPNGDRFAITSIKQSGGPFSGQTTSEIAISTLTGQTTTIVPPGEVAIRAIAWEANLLAPGY
ncbi:MAG: PD40 domain-containing protein [Planctomycetales bacterium]|nr:PD40 domain-containing protein [Planctomycetales bacterium]